MPKYETLNVNPTTKKTIVRLAKKFEYSQVEFLKAMAIYFDKTGVNPRDLKILSPAEELKKLRDTLIGFIRTQEQEYIKPTFGKMDVLMARFVDYLDNEAPKRQDAKSIFESSVSEPEKHEVENPKIETVTKLDLPDRELTDLKLNLEVEKQKIQNIKKEVSKIFNVSSFTSTGFQKKIVVEMPQSEFEDIKNMLKHL